MWGFGPFGGIFHFWWSAASSLFWIAVVVVLIVIFGRGVRHPGGGPFWRSSAALDILEQRYARGEIGRDEYLQKKHDLLDRGAGP
jgi:putative membrane protein